MDRTLLPPDFVRSDPDWLYSMHEIPVPQKFFYLQLRGLAWGKDCTPWLRIDQLEELTGKKASVIWGYMSALRTSHCLLWQTAKGRGFMFTFTDKKDNSEKSELLRKIGNASSTTSLINNDIELRRKKKEPLRKIGVLRKFGVNYPPAHERRRSILIFACSCARLRSKEAVTFPVISNTER